MQTRHADARSMWPCVPLVLILCLCAVPVFAQVPQATIERVAVLNVQIAEGHYLWDTRQIVDSHAWSLRQNPITTERDTLLQQLQQFSADDQKQANSQIQGLTNARLAILQPQWQAQAAAFQRQREQHDRAVINEIGVDARAALETQRRRVLLQQRRDRGEITAEEFAAEDKKALDDIMALRAKYVPEGQGYADRFDNQLAQLTQAMAKNPVIPLSAPNTKAAQGGTSADEYKRDVARAADIMFREKAVTRRYAKKEIDAATWRESENTLNADLVLLVKKWNAAGRGKQFNDDYFHDYFQPGVNATVAATAAAQKNMVKADISGPDYKRDVEEAANLQFQQGQVANRYLNKEIDANAYGTAMNKLEPRLTLLQRKWKAAGRQTEFQRDSMQQVTTLTVAAQSPAGLLQQYRGILIFFGIASIFATYLLIRGSGKGTGRGVSDIYGTAHYAPQRLDITDETCLASGVFFGKSSAPGLVAVPLEAPGAPVCSTPEHHTLIVARTRTGKGTRVIVPTLLRYAGSAFVIDPKGENTAITARARSQMVQGSAHWVRILNPWGELAETFAKQNLGVPATYNPLDILERSDPNAVAVAQTLAGAICPAPSGGKDSYWQGMLPAY